MAFALFSPSRAAGVLLALILSLTACGGGGGGGGTTPPVSPPADSTPPQVMSVTPSNNATGVAPTAKVEATYDEALNCTDVSGKIVQVAGVDATVSCDGTAKKMSLSPKSALPADTLVTATIPAATDMAGNKGLPVAVTFKTVTPVVTSAKLYVGLNPNVDGSNAVAIVNKTTGAVKQVGFPGVPGFGPLYANVVDALAGKVYFAPRGGFKIYVLDLATDAALASIDLDPTLARNDLVWDLTLTESEVCAAMSSSRPVGASQNRLQCWDRWTNVSTFSGANNTLATSDMFTTAIRYVATPMKKIYAINAVDSAIEGSDPRHPAGTKGTLVVLNPVTKAVEQTVSVGSVPVAFDVSKTTGKVYVANSGDKTVSIVNLAAGTVETMALPNYPGMYQRPTSIVVDDGRDRLYVTDNVSSVVVYQLSTRQELTRISLAGLSAGLYSIPTTIKMVGSDLWVSFTGLNSLVVISADTLLVTQTVSVGSSPVAFASYAPGNAQ